MRSPVIRVHISYLILAGFILLINAPVARAFQQTVQGANFSRQTVKSGELKLMVQSFTAGTKSPDEIKEWIESQKQELLTGLAGQFQHPELTQEYKREMREIRQRAESFAPKESKEERIVAFEVFGDEISANPVASCRYQIIQIDRRGLDLSIEDARYFHPDYCKIVTYDGQLLLLQTEHRLLAPHVSIFHTISVFKGFAPFYLFGRSFIPIPENTKYIGKDKVDGENCTLLEFPLAVSAVKEANSAKHTPVMRLWISADKDFCVQQQETYVGGTLQTSIVYEDFQQFHGEVWYPNRTTWTKFKPNGEIENQEELVVQEATFNLNFPASFFDINLKKIMESQVYFSRLSEVTFEPEETTGFDREPTTSTNEVQAKTIVECGPRSLLYVCQKFGLASSFDELASLSNLTDEGTTMLGLYQAAKEKGLEPIGVQMDIEDLQTVRFPAIAHVNDNHFLVVDAVNEGRVYLVDSAAQYDGLSIQQFQQIWNGNMLIFQRSLNIENTVIQNPEEVFLSEESYDFGQIQGGTTVKHTFILKNLGELPLHILNTESSCVCTVAAPSGDTLLTGQAEQIEVALKVPPTNTKVKETVTIHTDNPQRPTIELTLTANAYMPIAAIPSRILFGQIPFGQIVEKEIQIKRLQKIETKLIGTRSSADNLSATYIGEDKQGNWKLIVTSGNHSSIGTLKEKLFVDYIHQDNESTLEIPIRGEVVGSLNLSSKRFFFGLVTQGTETSKTIVLSNIQGRSFKVYKAVSQSPYIATKITTLADEKQYHLEATIQPGTPTGELSSTIRVYTNDEIQPEINVPIHAIVK